MIVVRDVKRSSNFQTLKYMFEFEFGFVKFGSRIRLALKQAWILKRGWSVN